MEKIFLDKSGIYISNTHLKSKNTTYIFSHITRVSKEEKKVNRKPELYLIGAALLTICTMFLGFQLFFLYILELTLLVSIFLCFYRRKPSFKIILHTHNEKHDFVTSKDKEWINSVHTSIHEAIVYHGLKNIHPFTVEDAEPPRPQATRTRFKGKLEKKFLHR